MLGDPNDLFAHFIKFLFEIFTLLNFSRLSYPESEVGMMEIQTVKSLEFLLFIGVPYVY
jgi:hypothetical protein